MTRRVSPMATELTRSWRGLADDAIAAKAGAAHGQRDQRVAEVAERTRATPVLVRRAVTARLALLRLEAQGVVVPDQVFSLPVGAAEAVARWAGRDAKVAWRYAADYVDGRVTFQALVDAERLSRKGDVAARTPGAKLDSPDAWRADQLARYAKMEGRRLLPPAPDDVPVQGWLYDDAAVPTGVIVVGPCDSAEAYMAQRASHCVVAVGVARIVGRALMLVPDDATRARYAAWLAERSVAPDEVRVATVVPAGRPARARKAPLDGAGQN